MDNVIKILNSNFFVAFTTIIAGSVAVYLYYKQKRDHKKDAAKTLYSEILNSERIIKDLRTLKQNGSLLSLGTTTGRYTMGNSGWEKTKYLFINDFNSNEWENLNTFFNQVKEYQRTISQIANLFPKNINSRTQAIHTELSKIASEQAKELSELGVSKDPKSEEYKTSAEEIISLYEEKAQRFITIFVDVQSSSKYSYMPAGTFEPLEKLLNEINTELSISSVGEKLKRMGERTTSL
jgi:hypothetical protein